MQHQPDTFSERVPPSSLEAEQSVLGACLIDRDAWAKCQTLKPPDFYSDHHQTIWQAMQQAARQGAVDLITVQNQLRSQQDGGRTALDRIGGLSYLTTLIDRVPTTANVESYAGIVSTKSRLRQIQTAARQAIDDAYQSDDPDQVAGDLQQGINQTAAGAHKSGLKPVGGRIGAYGRQRFEQRNLPNDDWIPSRFPELREKCPFLRREVTLIAMPPNNGKTTIAMNEMDFLGRLGYRVAFFELEQADAQVFDKWISLRSRLPGKAVRMGLLQPDEWALYDRTAQELDQMANVSLNTETMETMTNIRWQCLRMKAQGGLDFVIIDFLDRVQEKAEKNERYDQVVARIAGLGQTIARECNCHVMILAQVDVKVLDRPNPIPTMSDLANSKTNLAAWPDNIITGLIPNKAKNDGNRDSKKESKAPAIWGVECSDPRWKNTVLLHIAKGRHSEAGADIPIYADLATGFLGPLRRPWPWQRECPPNSNARHDEIADADHFTAMQAFKARSVSAEPVDSF